MLKRMESLEEFLKQAESDEDELAWVEQISVLEARIKEIELEQEEREAAKAAQEKKEKEAEAEARRKKKKEEEEAARRLKEQLANAGSLEE